jgi:DNA-binding SARP family transcriptional activator/TolB-like protein/tetratricopeptide (TPR) repeat protein
MAKLSQVTLRFLGVFAVEADIGRPIALQIRSKKARALLAYLAMKPDYRARREELATMFWGDNPDAVARHSLRQCLNSLRQDLSVASEILLVDRETVGLCKQSVFVDARTFISLARSDAPDQLSAAAELWHGVFLSDLDLDIEEFEAWRRGEANRLATVAASVFDALCRQADAGGDGEAAIAAAERSVELEPTSEDRQRTVIKLLARFRGREAALSRLKLVTNLLRSELDVAPEAATRALCDAIKRGDFELHRQGPAPPSAIEPVDVPKPAPLSLPVREAIMPLVPVPTARTTAAPAHLGFWRRRPRAAAWSAISAVLIGAVAVIGLVHRTKPPLLLTSQAIAVLPFATDNSGQPDDPTFAKDLTHNLIGYLSRFGNLRVISEQASDVYRDRSLDVAHLKTDFGVQYAIAGRVQGNDRALKIDFQLVNTATRTNVWSDHLQRDRSDPIVIADETARGIARMMAIEIFRLNAQNVRSSPSAQLTVGQLVTRGYLALQSGAQPENLSDAMTSFDAALQRNPHYQPALLAVARVHIIASMNFLDLYRSSDLGDDERLLNETLAKWPDSVSTLYSLALLQKYRRQYQASLQSLQRCLELNPSFLPAQAQIGDLLIRMGQPQRGLDQILQTIRAASASDPSLGYWYLFAAEAELELGHDQAALDWAMRANAFLPGSPLVEAWLAAIYATSGDKPNAAKYVAALTKSAPESARQFMSRSAESANGVNSRDTRIHDGLRRALGESLG